MSDKPLCPKCGGSDLVRGGNGSSRRGKEGGQRWHHGGNARRAACNWHGSLPIWMENDRRGIDPKAVERLGKALGRSRRVVITAAQNATPVWPPFFRALKRYCSENSAQLVVIPYRYKNPTSMWTEKAKGDDWWADELAPYLYDQRRPLNKNLLLLADIKTQPTATSPLQGYETISGSLSAIVGHPKLELKTVATPQNKLPKILATTGAVTQRNYIPSNAGKKGEFHHTNSALVIELGPGGLFHMRQLNATRDGTFCDLDREYGPSAPRKIRAAALVMGDTHVEFADPDVERATFGPGGMVDVLNPETLVWHDVCDNFAANPHDAKRPLIQYVKYHAGKLNVEKELDNTCRFIEKHGAGRTNIFPFSNHPGWLGSWVKSTDPRGDYENAIFWARTWVAMCEGSKLTKNGVKEVDPFIWWAKRKLDPAVTAYFLDPDDSRQIHDIEVGMHGHLGANGARGSIVGFTKIGAKSVIGHSHTPGIREGVYQVGTSSRLRLGYNVGPSSWLQTHCVIYSNGKRSLINIVGGKWRGV